MAVQNLQVGSRETTISEFLANFSGGGDADRRYLAAHFESKKATAFFEEKHSTDTSAAQAVLKWCLLQVLLASQASLVSQTPWVRRQFMVEAPKALRENNWKAFRRVVLVALAYLDVRKLDFVVHELNETAGQRHTLVSLMQDVLDNLSQAHKPYGVSPDFAAEIDYFTKYLVDPFAAQFDQLCHNTDAARQAAELLAPPASWFPRLW